MAANSMYENLMGLPLFNGVSYNRISEIVGNTRLAFSKYLPGETILEAGDPCTRMMFVIGGCVRLSVRNSTDRFGVMQTLQAPSVISPDFLFGRNTLYPATVTAIDTVSIMQIEKKRLHQYHTHRRSMPLQLPQLHIDQRPESNRRRALAHLRIA